MTIGPAPMIMIDFMSVRLGISAPRARRLNHRGTEAQRRKNPRSKPAPERPDRDTHQCRVNQSAQHLGWVDSAIGSFPMASNHRGAGNRARSGPNFPRPLDGGGKGWG